MKWWIVCVAMFFSVIALAQGQQTIQVMSSQSTFEVKLPSNPTTGYRWFLRDYNHQLIEPVSHTFEKSSSTLIGSGGVEVWTFKPTALARAVPHVTKMTLTYARPWEKSQNPKIQEVTVFLH